MRFNTNAAASTFAALLGLGACGTNAYPAFAGIFGDGEGGAASGGEDGGDGSASTGYGSSSGSNPAGGDDAAGNSPTPTGSCATGTCNGRCDSSGNCDTSGLDDSCGLGGTACVDCTQTGQAIARTARALGRAAEARRVRAVAPREGDRVRAAAAACLGSCARAVRGVAARVGDGPATVARAATTAGAGTMTPADRAPAYAVALSHSTCAEAFGERRKGMRRTLPEEVCRTGREASGS